MKLQENYCISLSRLNKSINLKLPLLVCLLLLTATACDRSGLADKIKTPADSRTIPIIPENPVTTDSDPKEVLKKAYEKILAVGSCRGRMRSEGKDQTITSEFEFAAPDRLKITIEYKFEGSPETRMERITIGKDYYMKNGNAKWEKTALSSEQPGLGSFLKEDVISKSEKIRLVGRDTLNGSPMLVYEVVEASGIPTGKWWIGARDNLIYKIEDEKDFGKLGKMKGGVIYYDYGADIKIEPPI